MEYGLVPVRAKIGLTTFAILLFCNVIYPTYPPLTPASFRARGTLTQLRNIVALDAVGAENTSLALVSGSSKLATSALVSLFVKGNSIACKNPRALPDTDTSGVLEPAKKLYT